MKFSLIFCTACFGSALAVVGCEPTDKPATVAEAVGKAATIASTNETVRVVVQPVKTDCAHATQAVDGVCLHTPVATVHSKTSCDDYPPCKAWYESQKPGYVK